MRVNVFSCNVDMASDVGHTAGPDEALVPARTLVLFIVMTRPWGH